MRKARNHVVVPQPDVTRLCVGHLARRPKTTATSLAFSQSLQIVRINSKALGVNRERDVVQRLNLKSTSDVASSQLVEALEGLFGLLHGLRSSNAKPRKNRGELLKAVVKSGFCDVQVVSLSSQKL